MNVLIIGDADSIWVKTIIEKTHLPYGDSVSILTGRNKLFVDFYKKNQVTIFYLKKVRTVFGVLNFLHNVSIVLHQYDLIIIHYLATHKALLARIGSIFSKRLLLVCWGSDILRQQKRNKIIESAIRAASAILISTQEMKDTFCSLYGNQYGFKIRRIGFGSNGIEILRQNNYDRYNLRVKYGIDDKKVIVSIGYNKMISQQHLKVLHVINSLVPEERNKIHILLRLTYGDGDSDYINQIKKCVKQTGCSNSIFESYLTDIEIAELTFLTDIFIHAQITDARSASMCEHLYSGSLVINPSWIKYSDIKDRVFYLTFNSFANLKELIIDNLVTKENSQYLMLLHHNKETIYDICSWNSNLKSWRRAYLE